MLLYYMECNKNINSDAEKHILKVCDALPKKVDKILSVDFIINFNKDNKHLNKHI